MRPYFYRLLLIFLLVTPLMLKAQEKKYYDENEKSIDSAHAKYYRYYTRADTCYKLDQYLVDNNLLAMTGYCLSTDSESKTGNFI